MHPLVYEFGKLETQCQMTLMWWGIALSLRILCAVVSAVVRRCREAYREWYLDRTYDGPMVWCPDGKYRRPYWGPQTERE